MSDTDLTPPPDDDDLWLPGEIELPDFDDDAYTLDDPDTPTVPSHMVPANNPGDVDGQDQDDPAERVEGLGGPDEPIWHRALPRCNHNARTKAANPVGYCLQCIRIENETDPAAPDARGSLAMCDWKVRIRNPHDRKSWAKVPKGSIGYFDSPTSAHGHIFENAGGGGLIDSTDVPTGHWGRIHGADLCRLWNYTAAWWSNSVNGNEVGDWTRGGVVVKPEPTPRELRVMQLRNWRDQLQERLNNAERHHDAPRIRSLRFRLAEVRKIIDRIAG